MGGGGSRTEKYCRRHPQDSTDDPSMAWGGRNVSSCFLVKTVFLANQRRSAPWEGGKLGLAQTYRCHFEELDDCTVKAQAYLRQTAVTVKVLLHVQETRGGLVSGWI